MMELKIAPEAMETMVTKAMFDGMTQEHRDELVSSAIKQLLEKPVKKSAWEAGKSPLQEAFDNAVGIVARKISYERLQNDPEFIAKVEQLFADIVKKMFGEGEARDKFIDKIAEAALSAIYRS